MDVAFRLIRDGAELLGDAPQSVVADAEGPDPRCRRRSWSGSNSRPGRRARVLGKPSPVVFRQAVAGLAADLGERLPDRDFAMVGDDLRATCGGQARRPARDPGPVGQDRPPTRIDAAPRGRLARGGAPDGIAATLADVVAALD